MTAPVMPPGADIEKTDPYGQARAVLVQGPSATPRAAIQAHNSFLARWPIVERRSLAVNPRILAAVLLMQYAWPDVFEKILNLPELFFYVHALITNKPNHICKPSEMQELYQLGGITNSGLKITSQLDEFRRRPELVRLFDALLSPAAPGVASEPAAAFLASPGETTVDASMGISSLLPNVESLFGHLGLAQEAARTGVNHIAPWDALTSGDPVLIKFSDRVSGHPVDLGSVLMRQLIALKEQLPSLSETRRAAAIDQIGRGIFGLGRLRTNQRIVLLAREWLADSMRLPLEIDLRLVYAMGHQASKADGKKSRPEETAEAIARNTLVGLVTNDEVSLAVRMSAARLLEYCGT